MFVFGLFVKNSKGSLKDDDDEDDEQIDSEIEEDIKAHDMSAVFILNGRLFF